VSRVIVVQFVSIDGITEDPYRTRAGTRLQSYNTTRSIHSAERVRAQRRR